MKIDSLADVFLLYSLHPLAECLIKRECVLPDLGMLAELLIIIQTPDYLSAAGLRVAIIGNSLPSMFTVPVYVSPSKLPFNVIK